MTKALYFFQCESAPVPMLSRQRLHQLRFPERHKARTAVSYAVRTGQLISAAYRRCFDCGGPAQEYDHYLGYEKLHWLDVEPVCIPCHAKRGKSAYVLPPKKVRHCVDCATAILADSQAKRCPGCQERLCACGCGVIVTRPKKWATSHCAYIGLNRAASMKQYYRSLPPETRRAIKKKGNAAAYLKYKASPTLQERRRDAQAAWMRKLRADPVRYAAYLQKTRDAYYKRLAAKRRAR